MVSHSMDYISHASSKVTMMKRGKAQNFSNPIDGIAVYNQENSALENTGFDGGKIQVTYPPVSRVSLSLMPKKVHYGKALTIEVTIECTDNLPDVIFSFTAVNNFEQPVMCWHSSRYPQKINLVKGSQLLRFTVNPLLLHDGEYAWNFCLTQREKIEHTIWYMRAGKFHVTSHFRPLGNIPYIPVTDHFELELRSI